MGGRVPLGDVHADYRHRKFSLIVVGPILFGPIVLSVSTDTSQRGLLASCGIPFYTRFTLILQRLSTNSRQSFPYATLGHRIQASVGNCQFCVVDAGGAFQYR